MARRLAALLCSAVAATQATAADRIFEAGFEQRAIPYPVATHPRLWITTDDIPRLRGWAVDTNPLWASGLKPLLTQAIDVYHTYFFPGGVPADPFPDPGDTQGYGQLPVAGPMLSSNVEQWAVVLAFGSLIDPDPANRIADAQAARNLVMYAMSNAALGHADGLPYRDPLFAVYNRANGGGEQWPLVVDWIYDATDGSGQPILSAADKQVIRNVFMIWSDDCLHAYTTGGDHPEPIGVVDSTDLLPDGRAYRMAANNYYLGHARLLTMMALSIDPDDDPPIDSGVADAALGNTLRSYILDATGAWLYQEFAMFGDADAVASAYHLGGAGLGIASGGLPPEGMLYGHSFSYVLGQLLALKTAGFDDASLAGPQSELIHAPVWDRFTVGYLSSLTPTARVFPEEPSLGPVYQFASYGDLLRLWVTPEMVQPFALLALLEQQDGIATHRDLARWFSINAVEGGADALFSRVVSPWAYSSTDALLYFLLLDPDAPPATDPRPGFPRVFVDRPAARVVAHGEASAGTMFDYRASWLSINHQVGDAGQFELYRNGEWLTKEMSNYDNNVLGLTTVYHNTLALQNACANGVPANLQFFETGEWENGSQWMLDANAGDPFTLTSSGSDYVYADSDLTPLYNRPEEFSPDDDASEIVQATRSILWFSDDFIVVYDRATSSGAHPGLFKRFNVSLAANPEIAAAAATEVLPSGQQLFVQTLLPSSPSITARYAAGDLNPIAEFEPMQYVMTVEDPQDPSDMRFLHVLQGADPGASMAPAEHRQSTSGTPFDGAVFAAAAVYFPVERGVVTTATFTVPTSVHTLFVAGLAPGAGYGVTHASDGSGTTVTLSAGGAGAVADGAGLARIAL